MSANCGKSTKELVNENNVNAELQAVKQDCVEYSLATVHSLLDKMAEEDKDNKCIEENMLDDSIEMAEELAHSKATRQSEQIRQSLNVTSKLWARSFVQWTTCEINRAHASYKILQSRDKSFKYEIPKKK